MTDQNQTEDAREADDMGEKPDLGRTRDALTDALSGSDKDYDDLNGFLNRADELAQSLLDEGITAMKIWPFDMAAERTRGQYISVPDLKEALRPFEKIRAAVGGRHRRQISFQVHGQIGVLVIAQN